MQRVRSNFARLYSAIGAILVTRYFSLTTSMKRGPSWNRLEKYADAEVTTFRQIFSDTEIVRRVESRFFFSVNSVFVYPDTGVARCESGIVSETSSWPAAETVLANPSLKFSNNKNILEGNFLVLPSSPYYHWLIEDLPAFLAARDAAPNATVLYWKEAAPYVKTLISALGCESRSIEVIQKVESLVFLDKRGILGLPQSADLALLKDLPKRLEANDLEPFTEKVYVSRRGSSRSPKGEQALEDALSEEGFVIVRLEEIPWLVQVQLFSNASVIVGIHGAGLANIAFCQAGTKVVEILDESYPNNCFEILSNKTELKFARVLFSRDLGPENIESVLRELRS